MADLRREVVTCAAARMGIERGGMALHSRGTRLAFTPHLVDLPGYGRSSGFGAMTLEEMTAQVAKRAGPKHSPAWLEPGGLGWRESDGFTYPRTRPVLVTAAFFAMLFSAREGWLNKTRNSADSSSSLSDDFQRTVERFGAANVRTETRQMPAPVKRGWRSLCRM